MVEVSNLYNLDIYTITGYYVGRVADVILNIRLGTISKLELEKKEVGFRDIMRRGFQLVPEEENEVRSFKNDLLVVDFDKVQAIGDIILINAADIKKSRPQPQPQIPNSVPSNPKTNNTNIVDRPRKDF